jgi:hypothetical protein
MAPTDFQSSMLQLLHAWCDRRALDPLRAVLPHYPLPNGFRDEWTELARALKTVRMKHGASLSTAEMDVLVKLQHAAEAAVDR